MILIKVTMKHPHPQKGNLWQHNFINIFILVVFSSKNNEEEKPTNHQFIVTLDGLKDKKFISSSANDENEDELIKKPPSPIVFNDETKETKADKIIPVIPDILPKVLIPPTIKTNERCKYWPNCRLKDSCEFLHPTALCKMFPMCKFGDRCLYIHPKCKFDASCTRKDCPYSHVVAAKVPSKIGIGKVSIKTVLNK